MKYQKIDYDDEFEFHTVYKSHLYDLHEKWLLYRKKDKKNTAKCLLNLSPSILSPTQKSWFISIGFYDSVQKCSKGSLQVS